MIRFNNVTKSYKNGFEAIKRVSFHLRQGEMAFLTGHSGAGKSTVLNITGLIEKHTDGQVLIGGHDISKIPARQIPFLRRTIGYVSQDPKLLLEQTVFENVALPLVISGSTDEEIGRRVRASLDKVGLLEKENNIAAGLSTGEKQRVGIARAVISRPALIIADEPTGNLDPSLSREIMHLFESFNQIGTSVLIASHDLALIATMPYRVLTIKQGRLINSGE